MGRQSDLRSRQDHDRRNARSRSRLRPLPRCRRRRHSVSHLSRHASGPRRLLHARHHEESLRRLQRDGPDYIDNVQRLLRKFETAKKLGACAFTLPGGTARAIRCYFLRVDESRDAGSAARACRSRNTRKCATGRRLPFQDEINDFVASHPWVFVIEQNRDAQLKSLLVNEAKVNPSRLLSVLHYDGTPITARFIVEQISQHAAARTVVPLKKVVFSRQRLHPLQRIRHKANHDLSGKTETTSSRPSQKCRRLHSP